MLLREFLDSLVQKYLYSDLDDGMVSTRSEKKEISLIFLEVSYSILIVLVTNFVYSKICMFF